MCLLVFWAEFCIVAMVKVDFRGGLNSYVCGSLLLGFVVAVGVLYNCFDVSWVAVVGVLINIILDCRL